MDDRALLERLARTIPEPPDLMGRLEHRRAVKQRNARIRAGALAIALMSVIAVLASSMFESRDNVHVPATTPPDPYGALWTSTDIADGSSQRMTISPRDEGYQVVLVDEVASTSCGDLAATMRGTAERPEEGERLVVEWRVLECEDGSRFTNPDPFEFRGAASSGTLVDQSGTTWTRAT